MADYGGLQQLPDRPRLYDLFRATEGWQLGPKCRVIHFHSATYPLVMRNSVRGCVPAKLSVRSMICMKIAKHFSWAALYRSAWNNA